MNHFRVMRYGRGPVIPQPRKWRGPVVAYAVVHFKRSCDVQEEGKKTNKKIESRQDANNTVKYGG